MSWDGRPVPIPGGASSIGSEITGHSGEANRVDVGSKGSESRGGADTVALQEEHPSRTRAVELLEVFLGLIIVIGLGVAVPGHWGLLQLQPHPLWIVVVAIAIRYGVPAGYIAGSLAAATYILLSWTRPEARFEPITAHELIQAFLLFVGGVLIGELVRGRQERVASLESQERHATQALEQLRQRYDAAEEVTAELQKRVVGQPASVVTLCGMGKRLGTLGREELHEAIVDLVVNLLEAQACALYLLHNGQLRLSTGFPEAWAGRREVITLDDPSFKSLGESGLVSQAVRKLAVVSIRDRLLETGIPPSFREPVVMAGPLLDVGGRLVGIVAIERMPFLKFTPSSVRLFGLILEWVSVALQNANSRDTTRDDLTGALTAANTRERLLAEFLRARRYREPLSTVVVQINDFLATSPSTVSPTLRGVVRVLDSQLRAVDLVGHHTDLDKLVLILPQTTEEAARAAVQRIDHYLHEFLSPLGGNGRAMAVRFGVANCSPGLEGPEGMLVLAEADLISAHTHSDSCVAESPVSVASIHTRAQRVVPAQQRS